MKATIKVDVPEYQIGQEATVYFRDTMCVKGICEKDERKKGRWITPSDHSWFICNHCKRTVAFEEKYCPECGAKMEGSEEE